MASHNSYAPSAPTSQRTTATLNDMAVLLQVQAFMVSSHRGLILCQVMFMPGTHPDVIRSFQAVDRDESHYIEDEELQQVLSSQYQRFSLGTIRLLMFLFKNPSDPLRIGPGSLRHYGVVLVNGVQYFRDLMKTGVGKLICSN